MSQPATKFDGFGSSALLLEQQVQRPPLEICPHNTPRSRSVNMEVETRWDLRPVTGHDIWELGPEFWWSAEQQLGRRPLSICESKLRKERYQVLTG